MLQALHKILSIIIALVVLFSSLSFTVEKHVCMGKITDTSFFNQADSCGMIMDEEDCTIDDFSQHKMEKEKCCNDIQQIISGNQNEQQALDTFEISNLQFVLAYTYTYINLFEVKEQPRAFTYYSPPLVDKDIQVLYQTFLI